MAVVTRKCAVLPHDLNNDFYGKSSKNGWSTKAILDFVKTQLCTVAISLTLFNSVRLPREAFKYGSIPYLVVYSFWLIIVTSPTSLLQLSTGQLSQQDPIGVWRAVPILRGVGHLRLLTSYVCCVYNMLLLALATAYFIWIGKGTFPLKDCTKLRLTPQGYVNRMNASECFNSTFLAPFAAYPQYIGIMAIIIFILWFFIPLILYRLRKSLKITLDILAPITITMSIALCAFLGDGGVLTSIVISCEKWKPFQQPYLWHSALVQALLSSQIISGYLTSAGGTIYRHSDVRWTATFLIMINILSGWFWVFMWEAIGGEQRKDTSFISVLILIYESSITERRTKEWPLLAFALVLVSGVITELMLLYPIYDKLHRISSSSWRLYSIALSATGTALTVALLTKGLDITFALDTLVVPTLVVFTTAVEVLGFVFIYGWSYLRMDIEFLTGIKLPWVWVFAWWTIPLMLFGVTGWWLRTLIRSTWGQTQTLWPLVGVFIGILFIMVVMAAVAVAKEEQFNLFTKITAAFRPSRLWGPEEPMSRYIWMSQKYAKELKTQYNEPRSEKSSYQRPFSNKNSTIVYEEKIIKKNDSRMEMNHINNDTLMMDNDDIRNYSINKVGLQSTFNTSILRDEIKEDEQNIFRSSNICIADDKLGGPLQCSCNRHFTLHVPNLNNSEVTTSL